MATTKQNRTFYADEDVSEILEQFQVRLKEQGDKRSHLQSHLINTYIRETSRSLELEQWLEANYPAIHKKFLIKDETVPAPG